MSILLVGLNHRTAPVEVREQLAFSREGVATALLLFRNQFPTSEAAIISTCNRVEMLITSDSDKPTLADVISFLAQARDIPVTQFRNYLYTFTDEQACRHFFRVASGLDSMVLGETQIVNQIKQAYATASEQGSTGRVLNRLFHHAFSVSKRLRTDTGISAGKVSIPTVAVDLARSIFADFATKRTLVVGAGDMAQLTCQHLRDAGEAQFTIVSRTLSNARSLAEAFQGEAVPFDDFGNQLATADIVIAATSCPKPIITVDRIKHIQKLRRGRDLFLIDLAVPRNVEPEVASLPGVYLYDVDALGKIVAENQRQREKELQTCEKVLDEEVGDFEKWITETKLNPIIAQMYRDAKELRSAELDRLFRKCPNLDDEQKAEIEQAFDRLVGKFVHPCVATVRRHSLSGTSTALAGAIHSIAAVLDRL